MCSKGPQKVLRFSAPQKVLRFSGPQKGNTYGSRVSQVVISRFSLVLKFLKKSSNSSKGPQKVLKILKRSSKSSKGPQSPQKVLEILNRSSKSPKGPQSTYIRNALMFCSDILLRTLRDVNGNLVSYDFLLFN